MSARPHSQAPLLIVRVSVVLCALCGAGAIALAARPSGGAPLLVAAVCAGVAGFAYPLAPRRAAYALVVMGTVASVVAVLALAAGGVVTWLLIVAWGSVAVLLAGLTHFIASTEEPAMATVTVAAVATLLALSGMGLAQYVRVEGAPAQRADQHGGPTHALEVACHAWSGDTDTSCARDPLGLA